MKIKFECLLLIFVLPLISSGRYSGGEGEPNDPYIIETAEDLNDIGNHPEDFNKCFIMVADINLANFTDTQFNIIGYYGGYETNDVPFTGVFDGNGHTISGFNYDANLVPDTILLTRMGTGIFGLVDDTCAIIKNVTLFEPCITAPNNLYVGALVGRLDSGTIEQCDVVDGNIYGSTYVGGLVGYNSGDIHHSRSSSTINALGNYVGGLIGANFGGKVWYCTSSGSVASMQDMVGGLVGFAHQGSISQCCTTVNVNADDAVGGLIGEAFGEVVSDCYARGTVNGDVDIGGLLGFIRDFTIIKRCYSTGSVSGNSFVGGLVGDFTGTGWAVTYSFWDIETGGPDNGIGKPLTTKEMQTESTFTDAGWDFIEIWDIGENQTYPFLRTHLPSDINKDNQTNFYDLAVLANHWLEDTTP